MINSLRSTLGTCVVALVIAACSSAPGEDANAGNSSSAITGSCDAAGAAALAWERSHLHDGTGSGCWSDMCGLFVYDAARYGAGDVPAWLNEPAATADAMMHNAMNAGVFHDWDGSCPCGAILFYRAHGSITTGHVVLCNGDGTVSSSGWPGWPGVGACGFDGQTNVSEAWLSAAEGIPPTGYVLYGGAGHTGGGSGPCAHVPGADDGVYCGASHQSGFGGGDAHTLYNCENGAVASTQHCASGCYIAPAGKNDACVADPCSGVPSVDNGLYCGTSNQSGFARGAPSVLYDCVNGRVASSTTCSKGCTVAPAGQPDHCD